MHVIWVEFDIKTEHTEAFLKRIQQQAADSLNNEEGCHRFDVCIDPNARNKVVLYEIYTDAAAFERHTQMPHFKAFNEEAGDWIADKQIKQYRRL